MKKYLIFTDLDGTLLNHDDYNFGSNDLLINKIISNSHKIILNSSKTFKEILFYINKFNLHKNDLRTQYPQILLLLELD